MQTLLFIHGFATGPEIWKEQIEEFSRDFKVAGDLEQIDHLSDLFIIGWSMGGWKALDLWQEHHQKIRGLVLVSAFARYVESDDYSCGTPLALLQKLERKFIADYETGMHYFYDLIFKDKKQHYLIDQLPVPEKQDMIGWFDRLRNDDKRDLLPKINIPVLLICGDQDPIVSLATAEYMQERIKNSELLVFPGVGHAPFLEEKEKFNQCLRNFISRYENK